MIRDHLLPALKSRFPAREFAVAEFPDADAMLAFPYDKIGPLEIYDDGDEITVSIGEVTHGHFGCYDESFTVEEKEKQVVDDMMDFLEELFADRVVMFRALGGRVGGWRVLRAGEDPKRSWWREVFLWSRAL